MLNICKQHMEEYIIIHTDNDLRILDWTPFTNQYNGMPNLKIINEKDLITLALNNLSKYNWKFKEVFVCKKDPHFICVRSIKKKVKKVKKDDTIPNYDNIDDFGYNLDDDAINLYDNIDDNTDENTDEKHDTYTTLEPSKKI